MPFLQRIPGHNSVFFPFMIAFAACMISAILIVVFYREKVGGEVPTTSLVLIVCHKASS